MDYVEIEEARALPGLRLVLTAGVPGPWGEAAKALFRVKGIEYTAVRQAAGESEEALRAWTAQTSAPVAVYGDERPRSGWADIIALAERLAPEPRLVPEDAAERAECFGLLHLIAGEGGFGWERRLMMLHPMLSGGGDAGVAALLGGKYGWSKAAGEAASARAADVLRVLSARLRAQRAAGRPYFVGTTLTALDLYWAAFAAMLEPLPPDACPMPSWLRAGYECRDPEVRAAAAPELLEHRDFVYAQHLPLPLDF